MDTNNRDQETQSDQAGLNEGQNGTDSRQQALENETDTARLRSEKQSVKDGSENTTSGQQ